MESMEIRYAKTFIRRYKKLPKEIKGVAKERERIFKKNPSDISLKLHKLSGKLQGFHSFSINYSYRVVFEIQKNNTYVFHLIGTHDIYK